VSALFGSLPLEEIDWSTVWSKRESPEKGEKRSGAGGKEARSEKRVRGEPD
jgi:hypothetical protein